ncbi:hypothetical protein [Paenibacillus agricola]|uniref:DUF2325 domain-containing protein n=1 Tax=Paenibacillus agricola TaxID=2716264 RepID=A0ABX0JHX9_9BACL|nr:hypothetical protein [Paenibacillus agricola]NHN33345.1 hypothetical protein [Paenibacillus agricola]
MKELHVILSFISICIGCNRRTEEIIEDFGKMDVAALEKKMEERDISLYPVTCSHCGKSTLPTIMRLFDRQQQRIITEAKIGTDVPVIDGERAGYVYSRTEEEQAEIDRGLSKWLDTVIEQSEPFWEQFENYSLVHWNAFIMELSKQDYEDAYISCGWKPLDRKSTVFMYRKNINLLLKSEGSSKGFWRAANQRMFRHFVDLGIESWDIKKDIKLFGRERVRFFVLNLPIPEELEGLRSRCIGDLVKKENNEQALLYRRIEQLSDRLENSNLRANRLQHEVGNLQDRLGAAYRDIEQLKVAQVEVMQESGQSDKIKRLKALIFELKEENKNLYNRSPDIEQSNTNNLEISETAPMVEERDNSKQLAGKTVAFFGGWRSDLKKVFPCKIILHDGKRHDPDFYSALRTADTYVVWWEFISHESMWEIKEWAADRGINVFYLRGMNIGKALQSIRL